MEGKWTPAVGAFEFWPVMWSRPGIEAGCWVGVGSGGTGGKPFQVLLLLPAVYIPLPTHPSIPLLGFLSFPIVEEF